MALTDSLRILITANGAQAEREFSRVGASARRNLGQAENASQRYSRTLTSAGVAMTAFGVVALAGLGKAAQAAEEEHAALLRLENSIQNMPELAGASTAAFLDQAAALQDTTKFADDATVSAQAMLGTFHLTEQQITNLIPLVQDYAAKFGVDLVTASKQVGRAVSGSAGALTRNGIVMDEAAFAADHYGTVLGALRENAGGFAAQEGQTLSGQIAILKNNMMDLAEGVGVGATAAFSDMAGAVKFLSDRFDDLDPAAQSAIGQVLTWGAVGLTAVGSTSFLVGQLLKLGPAFQFIGSIGPRAYAAIANMIVPTNALSVSMDGLAASETAAATGMAAVAAPVALTIGGLVAFAAASSVAVEQFGELIGMDWPSGFSTNIHAWNGEVDAAIAANPELVSALSTGKQSFEGIGTAMAGATTNLDELSQEIQDYLDGVFSLPAAQRELRSSFEDLFGTLLTQGHSVDDVAAGLEDIVAATAGVISAGGNADAAAQMSIARLREQKNAGLITTEQFRTYRDAILNIPTVSRTDVSTPGATTASGQVRGLGDAIRKVPPRSITEVHATGTAEASRAVSDFKRQLDALPKNVYVGIKTTGSATVGSAVGRMFPLGGTSIVGERGPELLSIPSGGRIFNNAESKMRMSGAGGANGGDILVTVPLHIDGEKVAEATARVNRRYNTARGTD